MGGGGGGGGGGAVSSYHTHFLINHTLLVIRPMHAEFLEAFDLFLIYPEMHAWCSNYEC